MLNTPIASNNTICYHAVQRIFRNAVVEVIRSKMTAAFGQQATAKLKAPFQKEWDDIVEGAEVSRPRGDISVPILDDFDYLGVNHFFNLFEAYYKILVHASVEPNHPLPSKATLLGYLKTIKDLRDSLSHPALEEFSFDDSHHLLNCARLILAYLRLSPDAVEIQRLMRTLSDVPLARATARVNVFETPQSIIY